MAVDFSAVAKWPNVPACYDWLSLDRRGDWRLQGERVTHRGLIDFMNRQYGVDAAGCWFVQNGPQRVFVELAYTPWVFRREGDGFVSHTGQAGGAVGAVYLDADGSILLQAEAGIGVLDDRDLARFFGECRVAASGDIADDHTLLELMAGNDGAPVHWHDMPLQRIAAVDVPERFNFRQRPQAGA